MGKAFHVDNQPFLTNLVCKYVGTCWITGHFLSPHTDTPKAHIQVLTLKTSVEKVLNNLIELEKKCTIKNSSQWEIMI